MTRALALVMFLVAAPAMADSKPAPAAKADVAKPDAAPKAGCKKVVTGRGLDRKVTCAIEAEISVTAGPSKPNVVVVHQSPRQVVGRPKSESRLKGLPQRLNP